MKKIFVFIVALLLNTCAQGDPLYKTVSIYLIAHQDDWQLFMGINAYNDMTDSTTKVVFIHTTAGDASCKGKPLDSNYYTAREAGAINSIEFCLDTKSVHCQDNFKNTDINGHSIYCFTYENIKDYFLRLPDGCGSCGLHNQSLDYLRQQKISHITSVDNSTTYVSWDDLVATIKTIISQESGSTSQVILNTPDPDETINSGDHPDHLCSAIAGFQATQYMDNITKRAYIDYHIADLPSNLTVDDVALKAAIFGVSDFGLSQHKALSTWNKWHISFLSRSYSRDIKSNIDSIQQYQNPTNDTTKVVVYPNPASEVVNIYYCVGSTEQVQINIYNIYGMLLIPVYNGIRPVGSYIDRANIGSLSPGNYIVRIATPTRVKSIMLAKQ